jgi:hypothetical protein
MLRPSISVRAARLLAFAILLSIGSIAAADEAGTTPPPAQPPLPVFTRFAIHGYLTQAYAESDQHQILGITRDGTTDYREAALQLRYMPSERDTFVVQLAHEREGRSVVKSDAVELDWGFYQHRFSTGTELRVGRVQLPFGIYNELRDVGTILPFYRLPSNYYGEGTFTNEALDGLSVMQRFAPGSPWSVEATGYYGQWSSAQLIGDRVETAKVRNAAGVQVWMNTPVEGLRVGGFASRMLVKGGTVISKDGEVQKTYAASVDGTFGRWTTRAEASRLNYPSAHTKAWYAEVSARVLPKLSVNAMTDHRHLMAKSVSPMPAFENDVGIDHGFGVNYYFQPTLVLKLETHRNRALFIEDGPVRPFARAPRADYFITSLSFSF